MVKIPVSNTEGQPTVIEVCWQPVPHQIFKITGAIVVYGHVSGGADGLNFEGARPIRTGHPKPIWAHQNSFVIVCIVTVVNICMVKNVEFQKVIRRVGNPQNLHQRVVVQDEAESSIKSCLNERETRRVAHVALAGRIMEC